MEGDSPVGGALRAMNQSSVAPFVTRLKGGLGSQLAWSSVPGQWRITVTIDVDAVYVDHQMSEEVIEATEDLDNSTVCTFEVNRLFVSFPTHSILCVCSGQFASSLQQICSGWLMLGLMSPQWASSKESDRIPLDSDTSPISLSLVFVCFSLFS